MSKVGIDRLERLCVLAIRKGTNLRGINTYFERMNKRCCIPDILQGRRKDLGVKSPESILILCVPAVFCMLHGCTSIPIKLHALISFPDRIGPHWEQDSNHYAIYQGPVTTGQGSYRVLKAGCCEFIGSLLVSNGADIESLHCVINTFAWYLYYFRSAHLSS